LLDAFEIQVLRVLACSVQWQGDLWVLDWKGFGLKDLLLNRAVPAFVCRDWEKPPATFCQDVGDFDQDSNRLAPEEKPRDLLLQQPVRWDMIF